MPQVYQGNYRLVVVGLAFALSALIQFWIQFAFGFKVDLILVNLFVFALFLKFEEVLFFVFLGVWLLNWRVFLSVEMIYFFLLPLAVFFLRQIIPGKLGVVGFLSVLLGVTAFYSLINFGVFYSSVTLLLLVLGPNLVFGLILFYVLDSILDFQN